MKLTPVERMRANARAWLAEAGFPPLDILDAKPAQTDRCFLTCTQAAVDWASRTMEPWKLGTSWRDHQPLGYPTAVGGWRECGTIGNRPYRWAAQLICHWDPKAERGFFELDFDSFSPNQGLAYAIAHAVSDVWYQKIRGSKTDPFRVAKARGWTEKG
jgi:hypothetical protein